MITRGLIKPEQDSVFKKNLLHYCYNVICYYDMQIICTRCLYIFSFNILYAISTWRNLKKEQDKLSQTSETMLQGCCFTFLLYLQRKPSRVVSNE